VSSFLWKYSLGPDRISLKGQMNGSTNDFTLSEGSSLSNMSAALNETENTITVNWSGGGQIKPGRFQYSNCIGHVNMPQMKKNGH
jgi:hypothetical protein